MSCVSDKESIRQAEASDQFEASKLEHTFTNLYGVLSAKYHKKWELHVQLIGRTLTFTFPFI